MRNLARAQRVTSVFFAGLLGACARTEDVKIPPMPPTTTAAVAELPLRGFWASEGYGLQIEFTAGDELRVSETTAISCRPAWSAKLVGREARSTTALVNHLPVGNPGSNGSDVSRQIADVV